MTNLTEFEDILLEEAAPTVKPTPNGVSTSASIPTVNSPLLRNFATPVLLRKKELPAHRLMAELSARGYQANEISEIVGRCKLTVQDVLKQPHTQQYLANEVKRVASEDERVVTVIKDSVVSAVEALADIVKSGVKASDRIAAANALLDRRYGKAAQPIGRGSGVDLDQLTDEALAQMLPPTSETGTNV